jgi:hypothetical protein
MLALLATAELLGMSLWFAASAVAPHLSARWGQGLAIGTAVGALTVGKATPYLVHAWRGAGVTEVVLMRLCCSTAPSLSLIQAPDDHGQVGDLL